MSRACLEIHVYQSIVCDQGDLSTGDSKDDVTAATVTELPCIEWDTLWDRRVVQEMSRSTTLLNQAHLSFSLVYDDEVKPHLLNYLYATFLLSEANIDCEFVP
jgi:pachytene checkpoint protein 2